MIVGSLCSGQLTSLHNREQFPSLTDALKKKVPSITINNKQHTNKNQKIIIIRPLADSSKSIFSNTVKFTKALMESPFNSNHIKEIRTNKQSPTIVAELIIPNLKQEAHLRWTHDHSRVNWRVCLLSSES